MRRIVSTAVLLATLATSQTGRAEDTSDARSPTHLARCKSLVTKEMPSAALLSQGAFCNLQLGDWAGALNAATRWLEHPDAAGAKKRGMRQTFLPLASKVSRLVFDPSEARVRIDGEERATASGVLYVRPGSHAVHASTASGPLEVALVVKAGETKLVTVEAPAPPPAPSLTVPAPREEKEEKSPPSPPATVSPTPPAIENRSGSGPMATTMVLGSLAVFAAGAGGWLTLSSRSDRQEAAAMQKTAHQEGQSCFGRTTPQCAAADDLTNWADTKQSAAIGAFCGALAFGVSALVSHWLFPRRQTP